MKKNHIIAVAVAIALWCGFMVYRHNRNKGDSAAYRGYNQKQMQEIARKSPRAAMVLIGRALDRYHKEQGKYPSNIQEIYPKYLASKSLIDDIDFHYEPKGNDFYLSTAFSVGQKRMLAYMEKDLRPKIDKGIMIAAPVPEAKPVEEPVVTQKKGLSNEAKLALARENLLNALREGRFNIASVSLPGENETRLISAAMPKVISVGESDVELGAEAELGHKYLVWKGKTGVLGFGNVQYPDTKTLSIFSYGRWFHVQAPPTKGHDAVSTRADTVTGKRGVREIAADFGSSCLVWKDQRGAVGFGNVEYPQKNVASVFDTDAWINVETPSVPVATVPKDDLASTERKSPEMIASKLGGRFLVWKDQHGTLGFGNVEYPEKDLESVFQPDGWVNMPRSPLGAETGAEEDHSKPQKKPSEKIVSELGNRFLVWKDKQGTLGFGNVQYPEKNLDAVFHTDSWINTEQVSVPEGPIVVKDPEAQGEKSSESLAAAFSTRHLVWKDKHGTLGFGNVQYPETNAISGIHVNGTWEPMAH